MSPSGRIQKKKKDFQDFGEPCTVAQQKEVLGLLKLKLKEEILTPM
jgi:hypothetical protein